MDNFYDNWLNLWNDEQEELARARKFIHEEELEWVRTKQDHNAALLCARENGFITAGVVMLAKIPKGWNTGRHSHGEEALYIIENGIADPKDINTCLMYSFCPRYTSIGIFEHFDNGGMQLNYNACKALFPNLSDTKEVPRAITDKIAEGNLGQKTGVGFYDWREVDMPAYRERVNAPYLSLINWKFPTE